MSGPSACNFQKVQHSPLQEYSSLKETSAHEHRITRAQHRWIALSLSLTSFFSIILFASQGPEITHKLHVTH